MQGAGDKIDAVLSLSDATGRQLWTKDFPGVRQDLLTIEDQIYNELAIALELKPSSEELARTTLRPTDNVAAYELYLKGRDILRGKRDVKTAQSAVDLYEQAIQKDPGFALAYAALADATLDMYTFKKDPVWSQKAVAAAEHAQTLNDNLPEVHFALGNVYKLTGKTTEAIVELKHALDLAPNSDEGYRRLANAYLAAGQKEEALQAYQQAIDVNPYYWLNYNQLGQAYLQLGQNQKALDAWHRVVELAPDVRSPATKISEDRLLSDRRLDRVRRRLRKIPQDRPLREPVFEFGHGVLLSWAPARRRENVREVGGAESQ